MAIFDINNFVIDRVRRGTMFSLSKGDAQWSLTQIESPSLSVTTDNDEVVDAIGTRIMQFDRAKAAELSGSNSLLDFGLLAAQGGTEKKIAGADNKLIMPNYETHVLTAAEIEAGKFALEQKPSGVAGAEIPFIYKLNGDDTLAAKYPIAAAATASAFKLDVETKEITLPTGVFAANDRLWIPYEYETENGIEIDNTGKDFPKAGRFVMEVLGHDVCNPDKNYFAYVECNNAKLNAAYDLNFTSDGKHPFTLQMMQNYCDPEKKLFSVKVPGGLE